MSSAKEDVFDEIVEGLDLEVEKLIRDNDLDLKKAGEDAVADVQRYKKTRAAMVKQREALKLAIKRLDKRIAIGLETIKQISTPT